MSTRPSQPAVAPAPDWRFPQPDLRGTLAGGLQVVGYHRAGQRVAAATVVLDLPLSAEPRDREGATTLMVRLLDEGSRRHPGEAFADALESIGAGLGAQIGLSTSQVTLDVPVSHLADALLLLREALTEPALTDADVARQVATRLSQIEQVAANSASTADRWARRVLFDENSRAARMNGGEPDTVAELTRADLVRAHAGIDPSLATLVLGGDFTGLDAVGLVEQVFGDWASADVPRPQHPIPAFAGPRAVLIDRPGAVQADLRIVGPGIHRRDPRWAALQVGVNAVGGSFLSRLNERLREELGWTYGVRLSLTSHRDTGSWQVAGAFRTEIAAEALTEALAITGIEGPRLDPALDEPEIAASRTQLTAAGPQSCSTIEGVVDRAASAIARGQAPDHLNVQLAELARVDVGAARAAYDEVILAGAPSLVVVGDAEQLLEPLRAAGHQVEVVRD